jgi:hypothetical protein
MVLNGQLKRDTSMIRPPRRLAAADRYGTGRNEAIFFSESWSAQRTTILETPQRVGTRGCVP